MNPTEIREGARVAAEANNSEALVELAKAYSRFLSPMFNLIPWDEKVLFSEARFRDLYEQACQGTGGFVDMSPDRLAEILVRVPSTLVVFRTISGYRIQELAYALEYRIGHKVSAESLRKMENGGAQRVDDKRAAAIGRALHQAVEGTLLPRPPEAEGFVDRHSKFDTAGGWDSVARSAKQGVSYPAVLYERYLGRPFAYAVDALSGKKADLLETPVENLLTRHGIPHYHSKAIERIPGFEQAPDFLIPGRESPRVVIEAKLAEDGGTARDKAARIERLSHTTDAGGITLIAVIDGKGFFRINDVLAPILRVTRGQTFTLQTLPEMVSVPALKAFAKAE